MDKLRELLVDPDIPQSEMQFELAHDLAVSLVCSYIGESVLPEQFEPIIKEITIARFQRFGSESVKAETVDATSFTYHEDYLAPYYTALDEFKDKKKKRVLFY